MQYQDKFLPGDSPLNASSSIVLRTKEIMSQAWGLNKIIHHNPSPNPISLDRRHLNDLEAHLSEFIVAEKSDGVRYQLVMGMNESRGFAVLVNRRMQMYEVSVYANPDYFKGSVFDGEMVLENFHPSYLPNTNHNFCTTGDRDRSLTYGNSVLSTNTLHPSTHHHQQQQQHQQHQQHQQQHQQQQYPSSSSSLHSHSKSIQRQLFLIFDVVGLKGESRRTATFMNRYHEYTPIFDLENRDSLQMEALKWDEVAFELARSKDKIVCLGNRMALQFAPKPFVTLINLGSLWRSMSNLGHRSDGLIISRVNAGVGTGTDESIMKWKQCHTVDLMIEGKYSKGNWEIKIFFQDHEQVVMSTERDFTIMTTPTTTTNKTPDNNTDNKNTTTITTTNNTSPVEKRTFHLELKSNPTFQSTIKYFEEIHKNNFKLLGEFICDIDPIQPIVWCSLERWRKDKYTTNNYPVIQKILQNVHDNVSIKELIQLTSKYIYHLPTSTPPTN